MKKKNVKIKNFIFIFIITSIIASIFALSKFKSTSAGNDNTRSARYIITMSESVLNLKINPDTLKKQEYLFEVSNLNKESKISEVEMEYKLGINTQSNLPLEFELYKINGENEIKMNLEGNITTDALKFSANKEQTDKYKLIVKWREGEENKSYKYSGSIDCVQIILDSNQVD